MEVFLLDTAQPSPGFDASAGAGSWVVAPNFAHVSAELLLPLRVVYPGILAELGGCADVFREPADLLGARKRDGGLVRGAGEVNSGDGLEVV